MPCAPLTPRDADDLCEAIAWARGQGAPLDVRGSGSKAALGRPMPDARILDLGAFSGVIDYEPSELVLTARAATPLAEIQALLAASRQAFAFEPIDHGPLLGAPVGGGTLGGMIAVNASGPRRLKAGAARDHFLGFEAVSGRGEAFKAGGKVVKNVTGYDLSKLLAGSWGTLAAMTEVTLKVLPAPETTQTLVLHGLSDAEAATAMSRALGSNADVSAAAHAQGATLLRLEGFAPSVAARREHLKALMGGEIGLLDEAQSADRWQAIRDVAAFAADQDMVWRASVPPMSGPALVADLRREFEVRALYDWGGGLVWLAMADDNAGRVHAAARAHGGHAALVRASPEVRAAVDVFPPLAPAVAALQRRVKAGFDPDGLLNPGRMYASDREPA